MSDGLPRHVLVFAPYVEQEGALESPHYDLPEYRAEIDGWMRALGATWEWVAVTTGNLARCIARARDAASGGETLVVNLCDGTASDGFPGLDVVLALEAAGLAFTGAGSAFYRLTTSKADSKARFLAAGVPTAPYVLVHGPLDAARAARTLPFPLFAKPDVSAGSYGIQLESVVRDEAALVARIAALRSGMHGQHFEGGAVLVEPFIQGREFTVLLAEDPTCPLGLYVLPPGERIFDARVPPSERFLAFERYWGLPEEARPIPAGEPYYWYELAGEDVRPLIEDIARRAFRSVGGESYARVDMRMDERSGDILVLEVNAQCGLSSDDSSTVGSILRLCGVSMTGIVARILRHGMARFAPRGTAAKAGRGAVASSLGYTE